MPLPFLLCIYVHILLAYHMSARVTQSVMYHKFCTLHSKAQGSSTLTPG